MITFEMRKPTASDDETCVGVTGENLACTREFLIKGMTDADLDYRINLRFSDGSVNSVIPDSCEITDEGTKLVWNIKKTDIFAHGYFELQIEGSVNDGLVFQTQIVTLYADESLAVEDKEYVNPNSETLKLRDETEKMLTEISTLQTTLENDIAEIKELGIDDKESLSNKVSTDDSVTSDSYPSVDYLKTYYYTSSVINKKLNSINSEIETVETGLSEANEKLEQKAECESGSGTLEIAFSSYEGIAGSYWYEKVGNIVVLTVSITQTNTDSNYFAMKGFPYACNSNTNLPASVTITSKKAYCRVLVDKKWISFLKMDGNFADGETIMTTVVYTV